MRMGMDDLIDERLWAFLEEAREFDRETGIGATMSAPGPRSPEEMVAMREALPDRPAGEGPPAVEEVVEAEGGGCRCGSSSRRGRRRGASTWTSTAAASSWDGRGAAMLATGGSPMRSGSRWSASSIDLRRRTRGRPGPMTARRRRCGWSANAEVRFGASRLAIGGASSGGNLAMTTLLRLRDKGLVERFVGVVLLYGAFDLSGRSPGGRAAWTKSSWSRAMPGTPRI